MLRRARSLLGLGTAMAVGLSLAACTGDGSEEADVPQQTVTRPAKPTKLTFGAWGAPEEVAAYERVASSYNAVTDESDVTVTPYPSSGDLISAVESGEAPDVFLVSRRDLLTLTENDLNRPLSDLLEERGVDFGDTYSRDALEAFSSERELQCMPYGISPDVVYYNTDLIDFEAMAARGLEVPNTLVPPATPRWSFEMFAAAAEFGTKPRRDVAGLYVEPTLRGLAPFIYSGGGEVWDDDQDPSSLALAEGDTREALEASLPLLRDARLTLSPDRLARRSAVEWFERGKLAMMVGTREVVPQLRDVEGLDFDVMPIPVIDDDATVGDVSGICVSQDARSVPEAADFLVHAISADSVRQVALAGYLSPANQTVALSDTFLAPVQMPQRGSVFVLGARAMRIDPLVDDDTALEAAVGPDVASLLTQPVLAAEDIETITTAVDEASRAVLDPESLEDEDSEDDPSAE